MRLVSLLDNRLISAAAAGDLIERFGHFGFQKTFYFGIGEQLEEFCELINVEISVRLVLGNGPLGHSSSRRHGLALGFGSVVSVFAAGHIGRNVAFSRVSVEYQTLSATGFVGRHAIQTDVIKSAGSRMRQRWMNAQFTSGAFKPVRQSFFGFGFVGFPLLLPLLTSSLLLGQTTFPVALSGPNAGADLGVEMQPFGAIMSRTDAVQTRVKLFAFGGIGTGVDAVLAGAITVAGFRGLQFGFSVAFVLGVLNVIAGIFGLRVLIRVEDESVGAQFSFHLVIFALEVAITLHRMLEQSVRLRAHKVDFFCRFGRRGEEK